MDGISNLFILNIFRYVYFKNNNNNKINEQTTEKLKLLYITQYKRFMFRVSYSRAHPFRSLISLLFTSILNTFTVAHCFSPGEVNK